MTELTKVLSTIVTTGAELNQIIALKKKPTQAEMNHLVKQFQKIEKEIAKPIIQKELQILTTLNPLARGVQKAILLLNQQIISSKEPQLMGPFVNALMNFKLNLDHVVRVKKTKIRRKTKGQEIR